MTRYIIASDYILFVINPVNRPTQFQLFTPCRSAIQSLLRREEVGDGDDRIYEEKELNMKKFIYSLFQKHP